MAAKYVLSFPEEWFVSFKISLLHAAIITCLIILSNNLLEKSRILIK